MGLSLLQLAAWAVVEARSLGEHGGVNIYNYVYNNALNRVDMLGLYEKDVHYYLTWFLAKAAGFNEKGCTGAAGRLSAKSIGRETQALDEKGDDRHPVGNSFWEIISGAHERVRAQYHIVSPKQVAENAGWAWLTCSAVQIGEYIHSLQDSFSHQKSKTDRDGERYGNKFGHGLDGHYPDWTWERPELADKMAKKTFEQLVKFAKKCCKCSTLKQKQWSDIEAQVKSFNRRRLRADKHIGVDNRALSYEEEAVKLRFLFPSMFQPVKGPGGPIPALPTGPNNPWKLDTPEGPIGPRP